MFKLKITYLANNVAILKSLTLKRNKPDVRNIGRDVVLGTRIKVVFGSFNWSIQTLEIAPQLPPM